MTDNTLSEALKEAYASTPSNITILHTLELRHPASKMKKAIQPLFGLYVIMLIIFASWKTMLR